MAKSKSFLGTGWSFPPAFNKDTKTVEMVSEEEDIRQSLYLILSTYPGERITNLDFGCMMYYHLFDPTDGFFESTIKHHIRQAITYFEPRIKLKDIELDTSAILDGIVYINLVYTIRSINMRANAVFPFYKIEGNLVSNI